ncbi:AEC family transporter [Litorivita pollutaquae]|uniref:AEC family transporter n=1 Tax=Litorivita pollutaquae TaxID=2200892 RepID=A0A2V4NGE8_9RHOB|nr:AEC family transporter [Litorivita pollutaquae]OUS20449.1 malonate transporter [Rhodobacterales bacterium 59_46_T64]PYC49130.1 AEC family transporter [Litorivita pollutaquae]
MQELLNVILPVFLVIGFGYVAVYKKYFTDAHVQGLMKYTQNFAIPCLLFSAISTLDLGQSFHWRLLLSFYSGASLGFFTGLLGAHYIFGRDWEESVAVGFVGLFSNSLMLGLPITERAFGSDALTANYAIISVHSPFCYALGITAMEIARAHANGTPARALVPNVLKAMFRNALILGILMGFAVNLSGVTLPVPVTDAVGLMVQSALPAALFGLGGVLVQYRPEGDIKVIAYAVCISLMVHPAVVWGMSHWLALERSELRSAVLTSAVAPGINSYVFANMYGKGRRVAASAVLIGTVVCLITVWLWLMVLP